MTVLVVDGQGGRLGSQLVKEIVQRFPEHDLLAVGTNSMATERMLKAGAARAATGENAVAVACRRADVIVGPVGMVIADALLGEVTPAMAEAVGRSGAVRILLPSDKCDTLIAGIGGQGMSALIADAMDKLGVVLAQKTTQEG
ncbi:MAG: DUF3842 family protein [Clostridiaceae bacterium]|nr:DUF3842 family protein [Clostridia bacterium]MDY3870472.1 DUF3842 family protein [Clostridiaceae bacterium]